MLRKNLRKLFSQDKRFKNLKFLENNKFGDFVNYVQINISNKIKHGDLLNSDLNT